MGDDGLDHGRQRKTEDQRPENLPGHSEGHSQRVEYRIQHDQFPVPGRSADIVRGAMIVENGLANLFKKACRRLIELGIDARGLPERLVR